MVAWLLMTPTMRALWLTPDMDRLFVDPASTRRRFLDRLALALDPDHADHGAIYERAMRQRNKLLREAKVNVEYMYAFVNQSGAHAIIIFRFDRTDQAIELLQKNNITIVPGEKLYKM